MNRQAKSATDGFYPSNPLSSTCATSWGDDIVIQLKRYGFAGQRWLPY